MCSGKVYKIIHNQSNICYIGSTISELRERWRCHKSNYNKWLNNFDTNYANYAIFPYFKQYGIENFKIILIKEYEVVDRTHLEAYEQLWISKLKSININHSFNPLKKEYRNTNKELIQEKRKKKYICEYCNKELLFQHIKKHERTKLHIKNSNQELI